jgi:hypothetical protein
LKNWFGWDTESLDEEIKFIFLDGATADEARGVVQFGEWEGASDRFELIANDGKTVLRLARSGPMPAAGWGAIYDDIYEGWINFVAQLRLYAEKHRGEMRRTLWLSSKLGPKPIGLLGLGSGDIGSAGAWPLPTGETISGEIWHRSKHQVGVTAREWGEGLLVVADRRDGGGTALLTTFGLDDEAFAALEQRWRDWWGANFPKE